MLATHNILAMSPELGVPDLRSNQFFITDYDVLKEVVKKNYEWIFRTMEFLDS